MLIRRREQEIRRDRPSVFTAPATSGLDRRTFLRRSGLAAGTLAMMSTVRLNSVRAAEATGSKAGAAVEVRKNICTHCSLGCTVIAGAETGVGPRQQPAWDSPINRGTHCAKGAAIREVVHGTRRLRYPLKLEGGEWKRISWDQAINEIGDKMLAIREKAGADSVYFLGSAKYTNESAYLFRKFGAFLGTNSVDHQARICHSTTVTGVANTSSYHSPTNPYHDLLNSKT